MEQLPINALLVDSHLEYGNPTTNRGSQTTLQCGWEYPLTRNENKFRPCLMFTVEGNGKLPSAPKSHLGDVTLVLYQHNNSMTGDMDCTAFDCTRVWVEPQVTWNIWKTANNWTAGGGDYTSPPSSAFTVTDATGIDLEIDFKDFVDIAYAGNKLKVNTLIIADDEGSGSTSTVEWMKFASSENATAAYRPVCNVRAQKRFHHGTYYGAARCFTCS